MSFASLFTSFSLSVLAALSVYFFSFYIPAVSSAEPIYSLWTTQYVGRILLSLADFFLIWKSIKNKRHIVFLFNSHCIFKHKNLEYQFHTNGFTKFKSSSKFSWLFLIQTCLSFRIFCYIKFVIRGRASCVKWIVQYTCIIFVDWSLFDPVELSRY